MSKWIIIHGNPVDGFGYIGPFDTQDAVFDYTDDGRGMDDDWWMHQLTRPEENE